MNFSLNRIVPESISAGDQNHPHDSIKMALGQMSEYQENDQQAEKRKKKRKKLQMKIFEHLIPEQQIKTFVKEIIDRKVQEMMGLKNRIQIVFYQGITQIMAEYCAVKIITDRKIYKIYQSNSQKD